MSEQPENEQPELSDDEILAQRKANLAKLEELGFTPYGHAFPRTGRLAEVREGFEEGKEVTIAGRLVAKRGMGKSIFAHIQDGSVFLVVDLNKARVAGKPLRRFS